MKVRITLLAGLLLALAACGGGGGDDTPEARPARAAEADANGGSDNGVATLARPAALAHLPEVELLAPGEEHAGVAPTFEWKAVEGAATYSLSVLGPDRPLWAWSGPETSVTFALRDENRSEHAPGLEIETGSWWSVAALDEDGNVLALSELRAVSPGDGPDEHAAPSYVSQPSTPSTTAAAAPAKTGELPHACDVVTAAEVAPAIGGEVGDGAPSGFPIRNGTDCSWVRSDGLNLDVEIYTDHHGYQPEMWVWGEPESVPGLGDKSYFNNDGLSIRVGWTHGEYSALIVAYAGVESEIIELAKLVDSRLP